METDNNYSTEETEDTDESEEETNVKLDSISTAIDISDEILESVDADIPENVDVEKLLSDLLNTIPHERSLTSSEALAKSFETKNPYQSIIVDDIIDSLNSIFSNEICLVNTRQIQQLADKFENTYISGKMYAAALKSTFGRKKTFSQTKSFTGILYSTQLMKTKNTLKNLSQLEPNETIGHFMFFNYSTAKGIVDIIDSQQTLPEISNYFSHNTLNTFFMNFFSSLKAIGLQYPSPTLNYVKTWNTKQYDLECGAISLCHLLTFLIKNDRSYSFKYKEDMLKSIRKFHKVQYLTNQIFLDIFKDNFLL